MEEKKKAISSKIAPMLSTMPLDKKFFETL